MEIERKFLIKDDSYKQLAFAKAEICQAYICSGHGRTVRIRMRHDIPLDGSGESTHKGYLTIKGPSPDGISRYEWEREISVDEAYELFKICERTEQRAQCGACSDNAESQRTKTKGQPNLNRRQQDACIHTAEVTVRKTEGQPNLNRKQQDACIHTAEVTVRKTEGQPNLNRKQQDACIHTAEVTVRKSKAQIGRVEKTRWLVKSGHHIVEVDEFHGDNQGLVIAEIELADPDEPYTAPPFLGTEVTGIPRYYNGYLSRHPYNTW